nr:alpha-amylase family glycosyl hydrolase [Crossiella equi]
MDCLWLQPFHTTVLRDVGYDVHDYLGVETRLGDPADFAKLMGEADARGIRVVVDLVMQHTSLGCRAGRPRLATGIHWG